MDSDDDDRPARKTSLSKTKAEEPARKKTSAIASSPSSRRRQDEEDDSPRRRSRARDEDDDDEDRPRRGKQEKKSGAGLIIGLAAGGGAVVLGVAVLLVVLLTRGKSDSGNQQAAANPPAANPAQNNPPKDEPLRGQNPPANPPADNNPAVNPPAANPPAVNPGDNKPADPKPVEPAQQTPFASNGSLSKEVLSRVKQATLLIRVDMGTSGASGSGFLEAESGLVLTNAHVVGMLDEDKKPKSIEVVLNSGLGPTKEKVFKATVVTVDKLSDLAVLKLGGNPQGLPPGLTIQPTKDLQETQKLYIFGFPLGERLGKNITITDTSVSSLRTDKDGVLSQIQVNGGMHHGNSGGPVVDPEGRIIGVAVAGIEGTTINFAIPSEQVQAILNGRLSTVAVDEPVHKSGQVAVGVRLGTIDPLQKLQGLKVDWWIGDPTVKPLPTTTPPSGDGRQTVLLTYNAANQEARGEILLPATPPSGKVLWIQPNYTTANAQNRWMAGISRTVESPPDPVPVQVTVRHEAGQDQVSLKTKGLFNISARGDKLTADLDITSRLNEQVQPQPGQGATVTLQTAPNTPTNPSFSIRLLRDKKPPPPEIKAILQKIVNDVRFVVIRQTLDGQGSVANGKVDLSRVPASSQGTLEDFGAQMEQAWESCRLPCPKACSSRARPGPARAA